MPAPVAYLPLVQLKTPFADIAVPLTVPIDPRFAPFLVNNNLKEGDFKLLKLPISNFTGYTEPIATLSPATGEVNETAVIEDGGGGGGIGVGGGVGVGANTFNVIGITFGDPAKLPLIVKLVVYFPGAKSIGLTETPTPVGVLALLVSVF